MLRTCAMCDIDGRRVTLSEGKPPSMRANGLIGCVSCVATLLALVAFGVAITTCTSQATIRSACGPRVPFPVPIAAPGASDVYGGRGGISAQSRKPSVRLSGRYYRTACHVNILSPYGNSDQHVGRSTNRYAIAFSALGDALRRDGLAQTRRLHNNVWPSAARAQSTGEGPQARNPFPGMVLGTETFFAQNGQPLSLMDKASSMDVPAIRDQQFWAAIERSKGVYAFPDSYTAYMAKAKTLGISVLVVLEWGNPLYDKTGSFLNTPYTDSGRKAFGEYCVEVLKKYGQQIKTVEIWNEYNGGSFVDGPALFDKRQYYVLMLKTAYDAIKAVRPDVTVLAGATVGIPLPFFDALFQYGALSYCDGVSVHAYRGMAEGVDVDIAELRALMQRHGVIRPIYVTEFGTGGQPGFLIKESTLLAAASVTAAYWYEFQATNSPSTALVDANLDVTEAGKEYVQMLGLLALGNPVQKAMTDPTVYDYVFGGRGADAHVIWGSLGQAFTVSGTHTTTDFQGKAIADPVSLTDTPIIVRGDGTEIVTVTPAKYVTNTRIDFGKPEWSYWDRGDLSGAVTRLQQLWNWYRYYMGDYRYQYLYLSRGGGHPGAITAIERYTSPISGNISATGFWHLPSNKSNGVIASIAHNGTVVWTQAVGAGKTVAIKDQAIGAVSVGDTIDIALSGKQPDAGFNATDFEVTLTRR
jgi:hypothetical protein